MGRIVKWLICAALILGLAAFGSVGTFAQNKEAPDEGQKGARQLAFPAPPQPPVEDAVMQQMEQQYGGQFRQLLRTEMHFMRIVAQPTKQQYEKIAADGAAAMKAALRKFARMNNGNGRVMDGSFDPRGEIVAAFGKSVRATLAPDQAGRYQKEMDLRTEARKRVVVLNLVAMMDKSLVLQPDQREKLREILANNWNESWNQTQILNYGGQYYPTMPDAKINPILSKAQRAVWSGVQKGVQFGIDDLGLVVVPDLKEEVWDGDPPPKNPKPASDKAAPAKPVTPKNEEKP